MKITRNLNTYDIEDMYPLCHTDAFLRLPVRMSQGGYSELMPRSPNW